MFTPVRIADRAAQPAAVASGAQTWSELCYVPLTCHPRWQKVLDPSLIKGPWTPDEDHAIRELVMEHGAKRWSVIAKHLHGRTGKQCRERWINQLDPDISKDVRAAHRSVLTPPFCAILPATLG